MRTITTAQLADLLATINRPQPIGFIAMVPVEAKAAARTELGGQLLKLTRYRAWIGDYGRMVNARLGVEQAPQTFQPHPRKWGQHISMCLVQHQPKGASTMRHYLSVQIRGTTPPLYLVETAVPHPRAGLRHRLKAVAKEAIAHLLPPSRPEGAAQGTEQPVIHRDVDLSNVRLVSLGGEVFKVIPTAKGETVFA